MMMELVTMVYTKYGGDYQPKFTGWGECSVCVEELDKSELLYFCTCKVIICNDCLVEWVRQQVADSFL